jgi:DNA-binding NarL/FixJ family response regulator
VESVIEGRGWIDPALLRQALLTKSSLPARNGPASSSDTSKGDELTPRQKEILDLARLGFSDAAIGEKLNIARKTVTMHIGRICQRLCLTGREDLKSYRTSSERFADELSGAKRLSEREKEVLMLVLNGLDTGGIAGMLGISSGTVRTLLRRIYIKTRTSSRSELISRYSDAMSGDAKASTALPPRQADTFEQPLPARIEPWKQVHRASQLSC